MSKVRVSETFLSINGETSRAGLTTFFIRFQGCSAGCSFCDTPYALDISGGEEVEVEELRKRVGKAPRVCLTGGEPLEQPEGLIALATRLLKADKDVIIETNGTRNLAPLAELRDHASEVVGESFSIIMDLKPPSANIPEELRQQNIQNIQDLRDGDELKCLVGDRKDYEAAREAFAPLILNGFTNIAIQPVYGSRKISAEIVKWILEDELYCVRFQLQLHKYIWSPSKRRV